MLKKNQPVNDLSSNDDNNNNDIVIIIIIIIIIINIFLLFYFLIFFGQPGGVKENEICKILWDMTIQCDNIIEARRPDIVGVEKLSNKAIIVDIASPWDHRVYEKESAKIEKCQDLKMEIRKLWAIRRVEVVPVVVGALGAVSKRLDTRLDKLGITIRIRVCCRKQHCWEQQGS